MPTGTRIQRAARLLADQYRERTPFSLDEDSAPRTVDEAYAAQEAFQDIMSQARGPIAGYKIAYTTAIMQQTSEVSEPAAGVILAKNVYDSPTTLQIADYSRLGIECEVAARIGNDLPASRAPYNRDQIAQAVDAIMPALEVIEGRSSQIRDPQARALASIATNISNAGVVLGSPVADWRKVDLAGEYAG